MQAGPRSSRLTRSLRPAMERGRGRGLCVSENPMSDRKQFRDTFEIMARREQMRFQLPIGLQDTIRQIQGEFRLQIESGENHHGH